MADFSAGENMTVEAKRNLRVELLAGRRRQTGTVRAAAAVRVAAELTALLRRLRPERITGYVPIGSEPGGSGPGGSGPGGSEPIGSEPIGSEPIGLALPEVLRAALPPAAELLLPVLEPDLDLDWAVYDGPASLVTAGRGLREPAGPRLGRAAVATAGLVVVPALAVDRAGRRLGRGGGSYDRALARVAPDAWTVALLHDGELVEELPAEPHDRLVRAVITPGTGLVVLPSE